MRVSGQLGEPERDLALGLLRVAGSVHEVTDRPLLGVGEIGRVGAVVPADGARGRHYRKRVPDDLADRLDRTVAGDHHRHDRRAEQELGQPGAHHLADLPSVVGTEPVLGRDAEPGVVIQGLAADRLQPLLRAGVVVPDRLLLVPGDAYRLQHQAALFQLGHDDAGEPTGVGIRLHYHECAFLHYLATPTRSGMKATRRLLHVLEV